MYLDQYKKMGNTASKLGTFLWSKVIKTIWIYRKLLEESKPCNEMDIFFKFNKTKNRNGAFYRFRKRRKTRKVLKLLVLRKHPCNLHGCFRFKHLYINFVTVTQIVKSLVISFTLHYFHSTSCICH